MLHPPSLSDWSQSEWSWYKQARLFPRLCLHWETPEQHYQSAGFPLHCKVTHYSSLFYTEKLQHACACPCTCMHVCKIAVMLGHDKNPERLQALNCSFRYSLISFALTVWLNLFSLSTFVFFFFFLLEPKESYLLHQLLHLQQSDSVPTNPSNLHWAQFYNTAAKTLKSFNVALRVPLKRALWCTPNINRTLGSWQTRPVYRQRWGHPDGSSQNMHLVTGASQKTEKLNSSYFWRWSLSCWLDSKLFANIGFEKKNK